MPKEDPAALGQLLGMFPPPDPPKVTFKSSNQVEQTAKDPASLGHVGMSAMPPLPFPHATYATAGIMDHATRKTYPLGQFMVKYFPRTLMALAHLSLVANEQHNPGEPMHWSREKSGDHLDCAARHMLDVGKIDVDGERHTVKWVWRAMALAELELEDADTGR
jgi:hypothetical protein